MRHYEIVFLVHPDRSDQVADMTKRYSAIFEKNGGKIHRLEDWGRRQLAYAIKKIYKAHYILINVECNQKALDEIKQIFRFNDDILRYLILTTDKATTTPSAIMKKESSGSGRHHNRKRGGNEETRTTDRKSTTTEKVKTSDKPVAEEKTKETEKTQETTKEKIVKETQATPIKESTDEDAES